MFRHPLGLQTSCRYINRIHTLLGAFAFLICLAAAQNASAATYTVITTSDSGAGSLRQAVLDANGDSRR
jgi:hypothetical protein